MEILLLGLQSHALTLLTLRGVPNREFAKQNNLSAFKRVLFTLAGLKYDLKAKKEKKFYRFMFVKENGRQLEEITKIVEERNINPRIDSAHFKLDEINDALKLVNEGHINGKVIISIP